MQQPQGSIPLHLQITVTNPTQRPLYLLPNVWWASSIKRQAAATDTSFETSANAALSQPSVAHAERGQELVSSEVLATGRLFPDDQIQPGEKLSRELSIAMPSTASVVAFQLILPSLTRNPRPTGGWSSGLFGSRRMSWAYSEKADTVYPLLCQQTTESAGEARCEPVETKSIAAMIRNFDQRALIFFKSRMIAN